MRLFARRFTVQERLGQQIADTLEYVLQAHGVSVYLEGTHLYTGMRGVCEVESTTRTTFWRGVYDQDPQLRNGSGDLRATLTVTESTPTSEHLASAERQLGVIWDETLVDSAEAWPEQLGGHLQRVRR